MSVLVTNTENQITTVTLNRPERLNALSGELQAAITDTFTELKDDPGTRVIILTGAGRAFSAGLDLKELGQSGFEGRKVSPITMYEAVTGVGKPVIGAINGFAITGGFELALMCDILIASEQASFADTHVRMGVVPGWGLSQNLARLIGASRAKEVSFTGNYIDAETAERWGLVNKLLPAEELLPYCISIATDMLSAHEETLKQVHQLIDFGCEHTLAEGIPEEARRSLAHKLNEAVTPETLEERRGTVIGRGRAQTKPGPVKT
ncbi:MAG: enoyl-CoA hydratase [Gammaproteobacteria bacterium]|jgi:enoyl-CoA hydratase|nr:enoyl-CoA hydratase [Gammaproteobacteria bacterium]|tara:strand:+ start:871 stop:1662 length:792 start_codon:yes stop_codon:yes gene_type:complete